MGNGRQYHKASMSAKNTVHTLMHVHAAAIDKQ